MILNPQETTELIPLNIIRSETALTRYPIHRLAKKGTISIELKETNERGEVTFKWEVDYSKKRGQPGPLAYKVDTLIINRRIEEAERPLPKVIKLGSLNEIAEELGSNKGKIKNALYQNAFAGITAKIRFKAKDGTERTTEFGDTRYGVVFTGEELPNGREADAIYIVLHDWYRALLDTAQTRPLDYDYLKELSPGAQRLYELLSFQIYGAIESNRPRAKLLYSDFCTRAPQTRYFDFEHVKKQMYKLHAPHKKSGYIAAIHFQEITTQDGELDWEMFYTPGGKARGEHIGAKRKPRRRKEKQLELPISIELPHTEATTTAGTLATHLSELTPEQEGFLQKLKGKGVTESEARKLVTERLPACRLKVPALDYLPEKQGTINRGGNVRKFIECDDWQLPATYLDAMKAKEATARNEAAKGCRYCGGKNYYYLVPVNGATRRWKCRHSEATEEQYVSERLTPLYSS